MIADSAACPVAQEPSLFRTAARAGTSCPRVLMVLKRALGQRGMQAQALRVTLALQERGAPVAVLTRGGAQEPIPAWASDVTAHPVGRPGLRPFAWDLYRYLCDNRHHYDLVHVHGFGPETFAALAARKVTGRPLVVKPSTAGPGTKLHAYARWCPTLGGLPARAWEGVDAWISISRQVREDLLRMGVAPERIAHVPNGVDGSVFHPVRRTKRAALRAQRGVAPGQIVLCTVTRLLPHKRVDLLVRTFLELSQSRPRARLWVVGAGEELPKLQALAAAHPHGERVRFWGHMGAAATARLLQAADLFVLLSRWEGLSNALLEAMACGLPPVVTDVSGMEDLVQNGVNGLLVPVDDGAAVTRALDSLVGSRQRRRELAAAARSVGAHYSLDRTVEGLLQVYHACHDGRPPSRG